MAKMLINMDIQDGEFVVIATNINLSPTGKLNELTVSVYGLNSDFDEQYLVTSFTVDKDHNISGTDSVPAMFIPAAVTLFRNVSLLVEKEFDEVLVGFAKTTTQHLSPKWTGASND